MPRFLFLTGGLWLLLATFAVSAEPVGFRDAGIEGARPLHVALWYPAKAGGDPVAIGENPAFFGITAVRDAAPATGIHPLVVLSHGYGGNWRNLNWLAAALAGQGYIVAAPDHPGTTTRDRSPQEAARLWERPHDLSRVIDLLIDDPGFAGSVDVARIGAIGHSLGGWTVVALAGGRFDADRFTQDCRLHPNPRICGLADELALDRPALAKSMADPRIGAIVSLDIGLARGFSPESLAGIAVPALVIGAGTDIGDLPAKMESGYLTQNLPTDSTVSVEIPDAIHFSFMQPCKPGAAELIEAEDPGEGIVCRDGGARSRAEIHAEVLGRISDFLAMAIPATR
ncbi:alpha/beta hydrolase family protein [Martelella limonii]|uniref:alpha/beta hydrolase family protein n=1 Tax=Martelella limonii TaxID=1647649 RepID=UPI001580F8F9|nr:alpha/beta hydrolase [Martelella limonii]